MHITLQKTSDPNTKINKTITPVLDISDARPIEPFNIISPVFRIRYSDEVILNANYCTCTDTARSYFITDIIILTGDQIEIHCSVDVLYTYRADIMNMQVIACRSSNNYNRFIKDTAVTTDYDVMLQTLAFPVKPFHPEVLRRNSSKCFLLKLCRS